MTFYRRPTLTPAPIPPQQEPNAPFPFGKGFLCLVIVLCLFWGYHEFAGYVPAPPAGLIINEAPEQTILDANEMHSIQVKDYKITLLATYSIHARVLSVKHYSGGSEADLSPADFAVGWERMSDSAILSQMDITQDARWYYWSYEKALPIDMSYIIRHSANVHIIPATPEVARIVQRVKQNNIIRLEGYLVLVERKDGFIWKSSTSREDTGKGSCELMLVEQISIDH